MSPYAPEYSDADLLKQKDQEISRLKRALYQANEKWCKAVLKGRNDLKALQGSIKASTKASAQEPDWMKGETERSPDQRHLRTPVDKENKS